MQIIHIINMPICQYYIIIVEYNNIILSKKLSIRRKIFLY